MRCFDGYRTIFIRAKYFNAISTASIIKLTKFWDEWAHTQSTSKNKACTTTTTSVVCAYGPHHNHSQCDLLPAHTNLCVLLLLCVQYFVLLSLCGKEKWSVGVLWFACGRVVQCSIISSYIHDEYKKLLLHHTLAFMEKNRNQNKKKLVSEAQYINATMRH